MEELTNKYFEWIVSKTYFDSFCHEFKSIPVEQKLLNLALYIHEDGDLRFAINTYKEDRSESTLSSLKDTLEFYIDYIRTGEPKSGLSVFLKMFLSEEQLIILLEQELKARLYFDYENVDDFMKKVYKVEIGGFNLDYFVNQNYPSKKDGLIAIFQGDLKDNFELGDFKVDN